MVRVMMIAIDGEVPPQPLQRNVPAPDAGVTQPMFNPLADELGSLRVPYRDHVNTIVPLDAPVVIQTPAPEEFLSSDGGDSTIDWGVEESAGADAGAGEPSEIDGGIEPISAKESSAVESAVVENTAPISTGAAVAPNRSAAVPTPTHGYNLRERRSKPQDAAVRKQHLDAMLAFEPASFPTATFWESPPVLAMLTDEFCHDPKFAFIQYRLHEALKDETIAEHAKAALEAELMGFLRKDVFLWQFHFLIISGQNKPF